MTHLRTTRTILSTVLLLGALIALTGCKFGGGPVPLRAIQHRPDAESIDWDGVAMVPGKSAHEGTIWLLPTWLSAHRTAASEAGDSLRDSDLQVFNFGILTVPLLPFWFRSETRLLDDSGTTATSGTTWTPLYASWHDSGWPSDEPAVRASGVPLFYSRFSYGCLGQAPQLDWNQTLWTLGPAWGAVDMDMGDEHVSGWSVVPLMAAGFGPALWTSAALETDNSDVVVHGPMVGMLGYASAEDRVRRRRATLLLSGILWYASSELDSAGEIADSTRGPLWGMLGWGRSDGHDELRVFWASIALD